MANTYITSGSKFTPYSFAEMLQPVQIYTEAYNKADEALNLLYEDAATKAFSFEPQDSKEQAIYNDMMSKLRDASDALSTGSPTAFKDIQNINKEYRKTMIPIQQKIAKRAELAAEQRELVAKNPNLRFTKNFSTESLDNITSSSSYDIIDLDAVLKETATEFAAKTSKLYRDDFDPIAIGNTGYYNVLTGYGYTSEEFEDAFYGNNGAPKTDSEIYKFYKNKIDAINSRTDISNDVKLEMANAVYKGMEASAGEFSIKQIAGKSSDSSDKISDAELNKLLKEMSNNSEQFIDGNLYYKDSNGRVSKVGTGEYGEKDEDPKNVRGGRPTDTIEIDFKGEKKNYEVKSINVIDLIGSVGKLQSYSQLPSYMQTEVDNYIGNDDNSNYTYYVKGNKLIIRPKKVEIKSSPEDVSGVGF